MNYWYERWLGGLVFVGCFATYEGMKWLIRLWWKKWNER